MVGEMWRMGRVRRVRLKKTQEVHVLFLYIKYSDAL